jgi:phage protein U
VFANFGPVTFQVLGSPESFEATRSYDYAEHRVVEDRPRLQWVADGLETIALEMMFHRTFIDPVAALAELRAAAETHLAMPLVLGNGVHRGYFVITRLSETHRQMSDRGDAIAIAVRAALREWAPGSEFDPFAAATPGFAPLAIVAAGASGAAGAASAGASAPPFPAPGVSAIASNPPVAPAPVSNFAVVAATQIVRAPL